MVGELRLAIAIVMAAACADASSPTALQPTSDAQRLRAAQAGPSSLRQFCTPHALVTFVIDDGRITDYTIKKPIFDAHGAAAVVAIISTRRYLSDGQLRELEAAGWEIANHSRTHPDLTRLTYAERDSEIGGAKTELEARGFPTTLFVYPYGLTNRATGAVAQRYYGATARIGRGLNKWGRRTLLNLGRYNFGSQYARPNQNTLEFYEAQVDSARDAGRWLIYMVHELLGPDAQNLGTLLDYIRARSVPIVTVAEVMRLWKECGVESGR